MKVNANGRFLLVALALFILDLPWLTLIGGDYSAAIKKIQGGDEVRMRPIAGLVVYPALAFLALRTTSLKDAFLTGAAVYAVYDFTVLAVFKDYPLWLSLADVAWGGTLFTAIYYLRERLGF